MSHVKCNGSKSCRFLKTVDKRHHKKHMQVDHCKLCCIDWVLKDERACRR